MLFWNIICFLDWNWLIHVSGFLGWNLLFLIRWWNILLSLFIVLRIKFLLNNNSFVISSAIIVTYHFRGQQVDILWGVCTTALVIVFKKTVYIFLDFHAVMDIIIPRIRLGSVLYTSCIAIRLDFTYEVLFWNSIITSFHMMTLKCFVLFRYNVKVWINTLIISLCFRSIFLVKIVSSFILFVPSNQFEFSIWLHINKSICVFLRRNTLKLWNFYLWSTLNSRPILWLCPGIALSIKQVLWLGNELAISKLVIGINYAIVIKLVYFIYLSIPRSILPTTKPFTHLKILLLVKFHEII